MHNNIIILFNVIQFLLILKNVFKIFNLNLYKMFHVKLRKRLVYIIVISKKNVFI